MDEGHDCQVQFQILHTCKQVQLRYALVNHEHKHVFPLQGPMFVKPVSCKKTVLFLELLDCAFAAARCAAMHTASVKHLWWPWMWGGYSMSWRGTWIDECLGMSFVVGYKPIGATWKNLHRASQCKWQQTPIQAHSLPCACWAGSCLLCCQHELSLNRHRPDYQELCHDRLSEWKRKGDESLRWAIHKIGVRT